MNRLPFARRALVAVVVACAAATGAHANPVHVDPRTAARIEGPSPPEERRNPHIAPRADVIVYTVAPKETDPTLTRYLKDEYVVYRTSATPQANLMVFMPGTSGQPSNVQFFLATAASAGYRAIGLEYNDGEAVAQACPNDPDPACSAHFREKRIFGTDATNDIDDTPAESIAHRLVKLIAYLDKQHPNDGWGGYLDANGAPNWSRIGVAGHSQGAGMAAYIAKRAAVPRVVLISSPWDFYGRAHTVAPWLAEPSATPVDRWYGLYHKREPTSAAIARAYATLGLDAAHIHVLDGEPRRGEVPEAYHTSMIGDAGTPLAAGRPAYEADWLFALGTSP